MTRRPVRVLAVGLLGLTVMTGASAAASSGGVRGGAAQASIVGGYPADGGAYPWMVALVANHSPNARRGLFCGGTLIAPRIVLTAGHCVVDPPPFHVLVGAYNLRRGDGQRIRVRTYEIHPGWRAFRLAIRNDVALVRLAETARAQPVAVIGRNQDALWAPGTSLRLLGFGQLANRKLFPGRLFEADLERVADGRCESAYGPDFQRRSMFCASAPGRGSCNGDSGGPVLAETGGTWLQVGVISSGAERCATRRFPDLLARLSKLRGFVLR